MKVLGTSCFLLALLIGCTAQPLSPEPQATLTTPTLNEAFRTPPHLRSTGEDACSPLSEIGFATLHCTFIETPTLDFGSMIFSEEDFSTYPLPSKKMKGSH